MSDPIIRCLWCKADSGLFEYQLDEAATLTCPNCGTKMALTAALKEPISQDQSPMPISAEMPQPPATPPSTAAPASPPTEMPSPPLESVSSEEVAKMISEGYTADQIAKIILGEGESKDREVWKGSLAAFNTKLQSMAQDLMLDGDLGDVVTKLESSEALILHKDFVELDIDKARQALVKELLIQRGHTGGIDAVDLQGELDWGNDRDDFTTELPIDSSKTSVKKALETYFV